MVARGRNCRDSSRLQQISVLCSGHEIEQVAEIYEIIIAGNVEMLRTDAEIAEESGRRIAIVYEGADGWHTETLDGRVEESQTFLAAIEAARDKLSHYVNRRGENLPSELKTRASLALWLMIKDDGTAMGKKLSSSGNP